MHFADEATAVDRATFYALARRGRPDSQAAGHREIELRYSGQRYRMTVGEIGPNRYRVTLDGISVELDAERLNPHERRLWLGGHGFRVVTSSQGADLLIEVDGIAHRISRDDGGLVRNQAPAVVVSIPVEPGDELAAGDVVAVIEIMKMESSLTAPIAGRVREVFVGPNVQVGAQEPLLRIEPLEAGEAPSGSPRSGFRSVSRSAPTGRPSVATTCGASNGWCSATTASPARSSGSSRTCRTPPASRRPTTSTWCPRSTECSPCTRTSRP